MSLPRPLFKSQTVAWAVGLGLIVAGSYCFHDAFTRRGSKPHWLLKTITPGM